MAGVLQFILVAVEIIVCFLLIGLILLQKTKGQGIGGLAFGAGMGEALFGARAGNILTKLTIILGCVFMAATLLLSMTYSGDRGRSLMSRVRSQPPPAGAPQRAPAAGPASTPAAAPGIAPTLPLAPAAETPAPAETPAAPAP